jgi:hypothetical protein
MNDVYVLLIAKLKNRQINFLGAAKSEEEQIAQHPLFVQKHLKMSKYVPILSLPKQKDILMRRIKSLLFISSYLLLSLSTVNSASSTFAASEVDTHTTYEGGEGEGITLSQVAPDARKREGVDSAEGFSTILQQLMINPNHRFSLNVNLSDESKTKARSYINRVTGKYLYDGTRGICALALLYSCYAYYSQSCAYYMITQGNYTNSVADSSNCKITPEVFPVFYALGGGSVTGAFNTGLTYYNVNWSNLKPYAFLATSYLVTLLCYKFDIHHLVAPVVYPICGGLTLSCLLDLIKTYFTISPKPNPIKRISTEKATVDKAVDLIAALIENKKLFTDKEITDYLYVTMNEK